jgi:hypothetical protein
MKAVLENALVLDVHKGDMTGDDGKDFSFYKVVCYEFPEFYPRLTLLKLSEKRLAEAKSLIGKRVNINVTIFQGKNKVDLTFDGLSQ